MLCTSPTDSNVGAVVVCFFRLLYSSGLGPCSVGSRKSELKESGRGHRYCRFLAFLIVATAVRDGGWERFGL